MWPCRQGSGLEAGLTAGLKELTRPLEVGRSIDTERDSVNEADMDAHAGFERPQLLQLLPELERRRWQRDEAGKRAPGIGVDADMVVERALAVRRGGAREV